MTEKFEIYFKDLTPDAQKDLLEKFQTTEKNENWELCPLAVIVRMKEPYP